MEHRRAVPLVFAAVFFVLAPASARRALHTEAPLAKGAEPQPSLSVDLWQMLSPAPEHVGMAKGASSKDAKQQDAPVAMQVSQEELDKFSAKLSAGCQHRFSAILGGRGPAPSDFGGPRGGDATAAGCQRLNGSLCATRADVVHAKSGSSGREMRSTLEAEGQGCLPSECLDKPDLEVLASFMQLKAQELVPGTGVQVELHVDCSKSGGSAAAVGEEKAPAAGRNHN
eukprot:CAMPEP_0171291444 /NCGR_PEP_ID=MMETSP0790-20130122/71655_1 /TAXON_ID=2925 /ORGANISM="Alexandrium catenella, Strain OF101" /LENGTH=226 /DNA_ID=CAMNT_0011761167 /DNA_START=42 /DNA_END=719 /DNA_ORIENTATION=+